MGLAVFDICDTLYSVNTTTGFLRFFAERNAAHLLPVIERWTDRRHASWWIGAVAHRLVGHDLARFRMIASLAGFDRAFIEREAGIYAADYLPRLANPPIMERLQHHVEQGDDVWLLSSSIEPVVSAIGRLLGVRSHGSELGFIDDQCTGKLAQDLSGRKAQWLAHQAPLLARPLTVYTDNRSDLSLLELADHGTIVLPKGQRRHWAGKQYDYVQL